MGSVLSRAIKDSVINLHLKVDEIDKRLGQIHISQTGKTYISVQITYRALTTLGYILT
jgi:hypothetical protein